ncbi:putative pentatricopeptide repeat-containing protein [Tripterygium wilfordii]|uniref:Putative pentatricopeptide repeat-containing protein n=1 Tax=Tripterygium wilfordii TaxID=458696 RepID=A0A7J7E0F4_TRIWF|nr:pentatricopeptide repeat-containing protein At2g21090 [Tripterygium wilfordii]KAF5752023.1 putative pentatricopeptide repeat-containing protein [Tripterygium wilfordii]
MPSFFPSPKKKPVPCIVQSIIELSSRGNLSEAISSLPILVRKGLRLPSQALAHLLQQCAATKSLKLGKWVHLYCKLTGLKKPYTFLSNNLIFMYMECGDLSNAAKVFDKMSARNIYSWNNMLSGYAKLGRIKEARNLFDKMPERDVISWNTMVIAYAQNGCCNEAVRFFRDFRRLGIGYNEFSFAGILTVCVKLRGLGLARQVHGQVLVSGFLSNVVLSSSVVDSYAKCGEMSDARRLFDEMPVRDVLAWTTLVSGYAKWGNMEAADELFDEMPKKNPVSWTALISGYARHGLGHRALELFTKMMVFCVRPDQFTFSSCLCACANIASLKHGRQIHGCLVRTNFRPNTIVVSSLIDMYSKCGALEFGRRVFSVMGNKRDVVLWNTMISALGQHGLGDAAMRTFDDLVSFGVKPDRITYIVILTACSHSGLVQEGLKLFQCMRTIGHGIVPDEEHYACLIDLLGRAGCFDELIDQLDKMPFKPDDRIWNAVLGVSRIHGNTEMGRKAAEQLIELEPQSSAAYILLSSIYAEHGRWESVERVRRLMKERCVRKEKAISWIEIENEVHSFAVSDQLHSLKEVIYSALDQLAGHMEDVFSLDAER